MSIWWFWLGLARAYAGGFYLETPTLSDRGEAIEIQQSALDQGFPARVVRHYRQGQGWSYVVVVDNIPDRATADSVAATIAEQTRRGVSVYAEEGGDSASPDSATGEENKGYSGEIPSTSDMLQRLIRAHGGKEGGAARLEAAPALHFRYTRQIATDKGVVHARHEWSRTGEELHLELKVVEGPAEDLIGHVSAEGAYLELESQHHERDAARTREVLMAYGPGAVLGPAIEIPRLAASHPMWSQLEFAGELELGGSTCLLFSAESSQEPRLLEVVVNPETWNIAQITAKGVAGEVVTTFSDWREIDTGLVVPFHVQTDRNGAFLEEIRVSGLDVSPDAAALP